MTGMSDDIKWWPQLRIKKYENVADIIHAFELSSEPDGNVLAYLEKHRGLEPTRILEAEGNSLCNNGLQRVSDLITGNSTAGFTTTRGMTGVGDSSTAFAVTQTSLQAATNTLYKGLDSAPGSATGVITAQTTYQTTDANYAWNEWCTAIATATPVSSSNFNTATTTGIMLTRKVQALGTKVNTAVWVLQLTITQA